MAQRGRGRKPTNDEKKNLISAIESGDSTTTRNVIVDNKIDINADLELSVYKRTALHYAVLNNKLNIVQLLVELGADVTVTDHYKETPLKMAVDWNYIDIVYYLKTCHQNISQLSQVDQAKINDMVAEYERTREEVRMESLKEEQEKLAYALALKEGLADSFSLRMLVFGPENSGKTSLVATLVEDKFEASSATKGADVQVCTIYTDNWRKCAPQEIVHKLHQQYLYQLNVQADEHVDTASLQAQSFSSASPPLRGAAVATNLKIPEVDKEIQLAKEYKISQSKSTKFFVEDEFCGVIWDFAGQTRYLTTHSIFIRRNNMVFIVFKASCDLTEAVTAREEDKQSRNPVATCCEIIHYWLQTVHSVCRDKGGDEHISEFLPTVVLVATHLDEITGDVMWVKDAIINQLVKELAGKPYAKHLAGHRLGFKDALKKYCFFISNKYRNKAAITQLKEVVTEISKPILREKHPLIYIKIEKALLSLRKDVITTKYFIKIAKENGFVAAEDSKEIQGALKHFHNKGVILHFPSIPTLSKLIFLSPQLLAKLFSYLIIAHPYKYPTGDKHDHSYERLQNEGVLLNSFLVHMLNEFNKCFKAEGYQILYEQAVDFLIKFGFIAEVSVNNRFVQETHPVPQEEKRLFLVPSQLPEKNAPSNIVKGISSWEILFTFTDGFLPSFVYHQIVSRCINWTGQSNENIIWLTNVECFMSLDNGQFYYLKFLPKKSSICLIIALQKIQPSSAENRANLIHFLQTNIDAIHNEFLPACTPPIAYVPCQICQKSHIKLEEMKKGYTLACKDQSFDECYYRDLFQIKGVTDIVQTAELQPSKSLPSCAYDSDAAMKVHISQYDKICMLKVKDLLPSLFSKGVVTLQQKQKIENKEQFEQEGMKVLLDDVILPSLKLNTTEKYKGFLQSMEESDDQTWKEMAKRLGGSRSMCAKTRYKSTMI